MQIFELNSELKNFFAKESHCFSAIMGLRGEVFRAVKERETIRFVIDGKAYFIKKHFGISWREFFKNVLRFRMPTLGAKDEWLAIKKLNELGIPTMTLAGYGQKGWNPLTRQSFIITEEITNIYGLRDVAINWEKQSLAFGLKRDIILELARIARVMHTNGMNHRDFYLAHFLADKNNLTKLYVIDLHRAKVHKHLALRWRIKDIAALYFSARLVNLSLTDKLRFIGAYFAKPWRNALKEHYKFLQKVSDRAEKLVEDQAQTKRKLVRLKAWNKLFLCDRDYYSPAMQSFLREPDRYLLKGETLKQGITTTVVKINIDNQDFVVKRYNLKSFLFWLNICLLPTRASICWNNAQLLLKNHLHTPKPVAIIEKRFGFLRRSSYYITRFVSGVTADKYFCEESDAKKRSLVVRKLANVFLTLRQLAIRHGDAKATNFIISESDIYLLDLDAMRNYWRWFYNARGTFFRDRKRFLKNWQNNQEMFKLFDKLLP